MDKQAPCSEALRVLVVDASKANRDTLTLLMQSWGYDVRLAHDRGSALEACQAFHPEVVLLGGPPGDVAANGELTRKMRRQDGWLGPRAIIRLEEDSLERIAASRRLSCSPSAPSI